MPPATTPISSPLTATVAHVRCEPGDRVEIGDTVAYLELMKMEHPVASTVAGTVAAVLVDVGAQVEVGQALMSVTEGAAAEERSEDTDSSRDATADPERADLAEVRRRRALLEDNSRPESVAKRHALGFRTARENIADLIDDGSFNELGGLAIAAQRSRRSLADLQANTPADGLITGTGTVDGIGVAVMAYDYTVLAGTQGWANHAKKDRLLKLAAASDLPLIIFAEGGGGRPGDTDFMGGSWLNAEAFRLLAVLSGRVPVISIVNGRCFAGNAALAGCADVIIATERSNLGMAGPAMIEGGGLGVVRPEQIGPSSVQTANGVIDVLVSDEIEAVAVARRYLHLAVGASRGISAALPAAPDQTPLRDLVPENRKRTYDLREGLATLFDPHSLLELRPAWGEGMLTGVAELDGRSVGVLANVSTHLGGAIDAVGADKAARHLQLCDSYGLPIVVLCDTPGFMVGPEAEEDAGVRRFSRMFVAGAHLRVPVLCVILRKAYGLGAQAMFGGDLTVPAITLAWPTAELGPMGLEGAVRLGFRKELDEAATPEERAEREAHLIELAYANAAGLNVATFAEIDDVIDPATTRQRLLQTLACLPAVQPGAGRFIDPR